MTEKAMTKKVSRLRVRAPQSSRTASRRCLRRPAAFLGVAILTAVALTGCGIPMSESPTVLVHAENDPFADVPEALRGDRARLIYATDRKGQPLRNGGGTRYGYRRSRSLAFGTCDVGIGEGLSWEETVKQSRRTFRSKALDLQIHPPIEIGSFPETPASPDATNVESVTAEFAGAEFEAAEKKFHELLAEQLAKTPRKEVFVYIHGFNNAFEEPAVVIAQIWHFIGRQGVPIFYTWPAGSGLTLRGYNYDRESGEFTVFHLKQFLKSLAACAEIEKVHLIAHSRGTDVLVTALRELVIEKRCGELTARDALRIGNVILAAPDMDFEVSTQRLSAEHLGQAFERFTIYVSENDKAIGISGWLFASIKRIGQLRFAELSIRDREAIGMARKLSLIDVRANTDWVGHNYFYSSPAVCSDLILILRDNLDPGKANGRPLVDRGQNCWELLEGYPRFDPSDESQPGDAGTVEP